MVQTHMINSTICPRTIYIHTNTYLEMMASMKVKAGTRSVMAEAKVGELYLIPTNKNICVEQLCTYTQLIRT